MKIGNQHLMMKLVKDLQWFVDLYNAQAVPAGVLNYLWDETGLGFASGTVALNLDWVVGELTSIVKILKLVEMLV